MFAQTIQSFIWVQTLVVQSRGELARFVFESIWFACPGFADGFKGREPLQGLETLSEVRGVEERCEVLAKLVVAVVVITPDSRLLEGAVHPLDLSVRPRVVWLCEPMLDLVRPAEQVEHMGSPPGRRTWAVLREVAELNAVISEHGVNLIGDDCDQVLQECGCRIPGRRLMELSERKLRSAVDGNEQMELSLFGAHFSDI